MPFLVPVCVAVQVLIITIWALIVNHNTHVIYRVICADISVNTESLVVNTKKENTMKLLQLIKNLFKSTSDQDRLNNFIIGKQPTTASEVEHWIRVYDQKQQGWIL